MQISKGFRKNIPEETESCQEVWLGYVKFSLVIFLFTAVLLLRTFVIDIVTVSGDSMESSYSDGDVLVVDIDVENIERYDVVIAKMQGLKVIKRVIALPGEIIQIVDGKVFVNGEELAGEFSCFTEYAGVAEKPYVLRHDEYFLMGDNRAESTDSRNYGSISVDDIKGVVVFRLSLFCEFGQI